MNKMTVFLFSGQGSHYFSMGKKLFDQNQVFRKWMLNLDDIAQANSGESVIHQLYEKPGQRDELFDRTFYTHPAIFMVEYSLAQTLIEQGVIPAIVVGSSLGEFTSAAVAGFLKVEDALKLVIKQALLFETYCQPGSMLAILHNSSLYHEIPELATCSELAAVNYASHFVVSGTVENIQKIKKILLSKSILCEILPVSYAFHSSLLDTAEAYFKNALAETCYQQPRIAFFSSLSGTKLTELPPEYFWEVIRRPICFAKAIQTLEKSGHYNYIDAGPGGTLMNFIKRSLPPTSLSSCYTILSPFHQDVKNITNIIEMFSSLEAENGK